MSVTVTPSGTIELKGTCAVEEAEVLLQHLLAAPDAVVDWTACESAHTAVIQVLFVARSKPVGIPAGYLLREHIRPLLDVFS